MNHYTSDSGTSIGASARIGLGTGASAALIYAGLFTVYAVIRSTVEIASSGDIDAGVLRTMSGSAISLMIATAAFTVIALIPSSLLGLLTALGTWGLLRIPRLRSLPRAGIISGIAASSLLIGVIAIAGADLAEGAIIRNSPETWWFWVGLPGLVWLPGGAVIGRRIAMNWNYSVRRDPFAESDRADRPTARTMPVQSVR